VDALSHKDSDCMVADSGTTLHHVSDERFLSELKKMEKNIVVNTANGGKVTVEKAGKAIIRSDELKSTMVLSDVKYTPEFKVNLFSVSKWIDGSKENCREILFSKYGVVGRENGKMVFSGTRRDKLYVLKLNKLNGREDVNEFIEDEKAYLVTKEEEKRMQEFQKLHRRLGHLSKTSLMKIIKQDVAKGISEMNLPLTNTINDIEMKCDDCELSKSHRQAFSNNSSRPAAMDTMNRLFVDVCGKIINRGNADAHTALGSSEYASVIVDEKSRFVTVKLLKTKNEAANHVVGFIRYGENLTGNRVKYLHSDGGGEYINTFLFTFCDGRGIVHEFTVPYTPQHNGIPERMMRTLLNAVRAMLYHAKLDYAFWGMALLCAAYVLNFRVVDDKLSAHELFYEEKPSVRHLRTFGCDAYVHVPEQTRHKLQPRAIKAIFIGYAPRNDGAWKFFDIEKKKIIYSRDAVFYENSFTFGSNMKLRREYTGVGELEDLIQDAVMSMGDNINEKQQAANGGVSQPVTGQDVAVVAGARAGVASSLPKTSAMNAVLQLVKKDREEKKETEPTRVVVDDEIEFDSTISNIDTIQERINVQSSEEKKGSEELKHDTETKLNKKEVTHVQLRTNATAVNNINSKETNIRSSRPVTRQTNVSQVIKEAQRLKEMKNSNHYVYLAYTTDLPNNYNEAMKRQDAEKWQEAMKVEMNNLNENKVFKLVTREQAQVNNKKVLKSRWVLTIKQRDDGTIDKYKARFVACGYDQEIGKDFNETFAPVGKYKALRMILALACEMDYELTQMDVVSAFLNANLQEEVYIEQPEGFTKEQDKDKVWLLAKAIYGIKQAPYEWNNEFNRYLLSIGFKRLKTDLCVYSRLSKSGFIIILFVFVDDILSAYHSQDKEEWDLYKNELTRRYKMKELGEVRWLLGMRVTRDRKKKELTLDQQQYITKKVDEYQLDKSKYCPTPEDKGLILSETTAEEKEKHGDVMKSLPYRGIVGSLLYASLATRPDICHAVHEISKYGTDPSMKHMAAAKRVLKYLNSTNNERCLSYRGVSDVVCVKNDDGKDVYVPVIDIRAYCDADWAGDKKDRKSTTGWLVKINRNTVSWCTKKQSSTALSSAEAEYMAIASVAQEVIWMKQFLCELFNLPSKHIINTTDIYSDNTSAITISKNDIHHERTKHIDIKYHFIREGQKNNKFHIKWLPTKLQIADIFTKGVYGAQFNLLSNSVLFATLPEELSTEQCM
jgi:hypothetical protein